jgi:hypothetical protein
MKKNHIKILLLIFLLPLQLLSSTYEWKAFIDKERAYTNEAIYLKYVCEFSDRAELFSIEFNPVTQNEEYTLKLLRETTKVKNYKKIITYEFIVFVHKAGVREFEFEMSMQETNQDSIENTVIGRDNGKYEEYEERFMKQKKLIVEVEDAKSPIVGALKMSVSKGQSEVKSLMPYNLEIQLSGNVNFDAIKAATFEIEGVKLFAQEPHETIELTKEGYKGVWSQKFAFVSEKDFSVPPFSLEYFDLLSKEIKKLEFSGVDVVVKEGYKREELLDELEEEYVLDYSYLYCFLAFVMGFLVAKIRFKRDEKNESKDELFKQKIEAAKTMDEVLFILALQNSLQYREIISQIETKELTSLKEVKKLI